MDSGDRHRLLSRPAVWAAALAALAAPRAVAQGSAGRPDSLPPGVTAAMVAQGKKLFAGEGLCLACHGPDGKGGIGPNLTDQVWLHGQGDFAEIVTRVFEGVGLEASKSGQIMPPRGGASLSDDQVRAVAAYVWTLARKPGGK